MGSCLNKQNNLCNIPNSILLPFLRVNANFTVKGFGMGSPVNLLHLFAVIYNIFCPPPNCVSFFLYDIGDMIGARFPCVVRGTRTITCDAKNIEREKGKERKKKSGIP